MTPEPTAATAGGQAPVLEVRDLVKHFKVKGSRKDVVHAIDGVSFSIPAGQTLGLVGESGCGKSTVARTVLRVHEPTSGQVLVDGEDFTALGRSQLRERRRLLQMVFQDPYSSLNPRQTVADLVAEPLIAHQIGAKSEHRGLVEQMLVRVGLDPRHSQRYPHEFSGGQRQRIGIARALICGPRLVVCDEPISALDVSIQAQVVNLLRELQDEQELAYLFIAHDLSMVRFVSDQIGVMYLGQIVELCSADQIHANPLHPYTQGLLASAPNAKLALAERTAGNQVIRPQAVTGDLPSPIHPPSGCRFRTRCPFAMEVCATVPPPLNDAGDGHLVACHLHPGIGNPVPVELTARPTQATSPDPTTNPKETP